MKVFLSYASEQRTQAEEIAVGLRSEGHNVFFDRSSLPAGETFSQAIREAIAASDCMVALLSPDFFADGSYARTELDFAQRKWPNPGGRLLPVVVEPTAVEHIPIYLRSVTILEPVGNLTAEVLGAIHRLEQGMGWRRTRRAMARAVFGICVFTAVLITSFYIWRWTTSPALKPGFDFLKRENIETAHWSNGQQQLALLIDDVPRTPQNIGDVRLYLRELRLENGEERTNVLHTHPRWVSGGIVQGRYGPFKIISSLRLRGQFGFSFRPGGGTDGVRYRILFRPLLPGKEVEVWSSNKNYDGRLYSFDQSLQSIGGRVGYLVLEVYAKQDSGGDWATWVSLKAE